MRTPWGDSAEAWKAASPRTYFGRHVPPTLVLIGTADEAWRVEDNKEGVNALRLAGVEVRFHLLPDITHTSIRDGAGRIAPAALQELLPFLAQVTGTTSSR
jgi:dipeptidyl aminopeptidase/acylaminoacyl peptidase